MSGRLRPTILVIIGISGDLSRRKLLPALRQIAEAGALPKQFRIVGVTRRPLTLDDVLPDGDQQFLRDHLELYQMDITQSVDYSRLAERLQQVEADIGAPAQRLCYISIPPQAALPVIRLLGSSPLNTLDLKVLLEKPFGVDLASAEELIAATAEHIPEGQVYRIDHYLAKEMTQNIVVFRCANALFRQTWSNEFIEAIEIVASEEIGIEGRGLFYEQTGALRDLVQSHLLQLAALTLMELPPAGDWSAIPAHRLRALRQLVPPADVRAAVVRGQYEGYRDEVNNPGSMVETFVALTLHSSDPRWQGVPVRIVTGKALGRKTTEICITYKPEAGFGANMLMLRIQPNEGVEICLWAKKPGYDNDMQRLRLDFSYNNHYETLPEAYERVFIDAMRGDRTLFTTSEEVLAAWRILAPIQQAWDMASDDLLSYKPGSMPDVPDAV